MLDNERIGRAIRTLREKAGYTQKELAEKLFISGVAVSKWERGKSMPDTATLQKLAALLDMDVDGLLDGSASYLDENWRGVLLLDGAALPADTVLHDKPLIDYLLSLFLLAGIRDVEIACSERDGAYIDERFRGGALLGIRLRFTAPEALRLAETTRRRPADVLLIPEPFFIYGVDLTRFLQRAMQRRGELVNLTSVVGGRGGTGADGFSHYAYQSVPLYFLRAKQLRDAVGAAELRARLSAPETVEKTLSEPMDKGFLVSRLQTAADAERVSALVRLIEELCDCLVFCPPEIAWRRGMLEKEALLRAAAALPEYREYLISEL